MIKKKFIFNGDDFGYSQGVNEGIVEAHVNGILTSTSVMVLREAAEAAQDLNAYPNLSVGLHLDMTEEGMQRWIGMLSIFARKPSDIKSAFLAQVERFTDIMGKFPDHIDGHHHIHKHPHVWPIVREFAKEHGIPVRAASSAKFERGFYRRKTSPTGLIAMMQNLPNGVYEVMCHPGKDPTNDVGLVGSTYRKQREWEYETLIHPAVKEFIQANDSIALINWKDVPAP